MQDYDSFRNHPFICKIANNERWTVSTSDKVPLDMHMLTTKGIIVGAKYKDDLSLVTLDKAHEIIPDAVNYAFYMDALIDKIVVLDIEPKCPNKQRQELMSMPCLYAETSMSGKGIHMAFELPEDILNKYPIAKEKIVFKESHGYYEILLAHYITFTGNIITLSNTQPPEKFLNLFEDMAKEQKIVKKADVHIDTSITTLPTKHAEMIVEYLKKQSYDKTPEDFEGDVSKYEFGFMGHYHFKLRVMLDYPFSFTPDRREYTDTEVACMLVKIAEAQIPPRPKHNEIRNGLPWLWYIASDIIARYKGEKQPETQTKKKKKTNPKKKDK